MKLAINWEQVDSSNLEAVAYFPQSETLAVRFKGNALYSYMQVTDDQYNDFMRAPSMGKYLNAVIKVTSPYTRWEDETELLKHLSA